MSIINYCITKYNDLLNKEKLSSCTNLRIECDINIEDKLKEYDNIKSLEIWPLNNYYSNPLHYLPSALEKLTLCLSESFTHPLDNIPNTVTCLSIYGHCKKLNINKYPDNLECLYLDGFFNQPLLNLPPNLKVLDIDGVFNQELTGLPYGLKHLTIGGNYQLPIKSLPETIMYISIHNTSFNQPLTKENLPPNLLELAITGSDNFNQPLTSLPDSLQKLYIGSKRFNQSLDWLPAGLYKLHLSCQELNYSLNNLPPNLKELYISITNNYSIPITTLPESLEVLLIMDPVDCDFNNLPNTIKTLYVRYEYSSLPELLPDSVEELTIRYLKLIHKLPANLKKIRFLNKIAKYNFNKELLMLKPDLVIES